MMVYFSGKITHSVLNFLTHKGVSLDSLYEWVEIGPDQLRDTTGWIFADQVEDFLKQIETEYQAEFVDINFCEELGHASESLKSWGVLDSVLRMMSSPKDIFCQPQRFISYFISPEPPLVNIERDDDGISFDLPISAEEYPYVTTYLAAALEALPTFMGSELAQVTWKETRVSVSYQSQQDQLFKRSEETPNYKPELMQSLVCSLEDNEKILEKKDLQIRELENEVSQLKARLGRVVSQQAQPQTIINKEEWAAKALAAIESPLNNVHNQVMKLGDYMGRAQQLVTLMSALAGQNGQMKEAMRRMDWDYIRSEYPVLIQSSINEIGEMKEAIQFLDLEVKEPEQTVEENCVQMNLNTVVSRAIESVQSQIPSRIEIDSMLFLDRPIELFPEQMEYALEKILAHTAQRIKKEGKIRIVTRPKGSRAEIEITDNGRLSRQGLTGKESQLGVADSIIRLHQGHLSFQKGEDLGATCLIDLPMKFNSVPENQPER